MLLTLTIIDMKTKNVLKSLLSLLLIATVQSCNVEQNPELWKVEIEDAYKFQMAQAMAYTAVAFMELDNDEVDAAVNAVIKSADAMAELHYSKGESNVARYYLALKEYSQKDNICYYLWEQYHSFDGKVNFGEFVKQPKDGDFSVWLTTEKNSDIRVTFKIRTVNNNDEFQVAVDDKDLQVYINNITSAHYEDRLNSAIESAVDDAVNDALIDILTDDEWYQ